MPKKQSEYMKLADAIMHDPEREKRDAAISKRNRVLKESETVLRDTVIECFQRIYAVNRPICDRPGDARDLTVSHILQLLQDRITESVIPTCQSVHRF